MRVLGHEYAADIRCGPGTRHGMMRRVDTTKGASDRGRAYGGVFARRDFRLLWAGETVSGLGNGITAVALPLIAVEVLDAGSTAVGLLAGAVGLPWLLVGLPVGAWVDRTRKRPLMIACDLVAGGPTARRACSAGSWRRPR